MTPMRILLVSEDIPHFHLGGLGKHAVTLGNALIDAGHRVDLMGNVHCPMEQKPGEVHFHGKFLQALDMSHTGWKEPRLGFFIYQRRAYLARRYARAILAVARNYDVIHYHGHLPIIANYIPRDVNFIQTRHDQGSDCLTCTRFRNGEVCRETDPRACAACATANPNVLQRSLSAASVRQWRQEVNRAFHRHKTIFVSRFLQDNLGRTLDSLDTARGRVVHNFVDAGALGRFAASGGTAIEAPDIFIAARIEGPKGVGQFLAEFELQRPPGRHVTVAGDGPALAALRQRFQGDWVSFLGWQPYARAVVLASRCRVAVVPSVLEESCGTTVLEALALGRPVAALRRGGTPELEIYQRFPGQLQLCDDLGALCAAVTDSAAAALDGPPVSGADVHAIRPQVEAAYAWRP